MTVLAVAPERVFLATESFIDTPSPTITDDHARVAMQMDSNDYGRVNFTSQTGNVWAHGIWNYLHSATNAILFEDGSGNNILQLSYDVLPSRTYRIEYWPTSSATATEIDTGIAIPVVEGDITVDLHVNVTTGQVDLYLDGVLEWSDTLTFYRTECSTVLIGGGASDSKVRDIIVANESTVGWRVDIKYLTGAGNYSAQASGLYSDIDEADPDTADKMVIDTADARASFVTNSPPALAGGEEIKAIAVAGELQRTATGPNTATPFLRSSSTDTDGAAIALDAAWGRFQQIFTSGLDKDAEIGILATTV